MTKKNNLISGLFIIGLSLWYVFYIYYFSVNLPFQDDTVLVEFINVVSNPNASTADFFKNLFLVYNDHCIAIPRLVAFLDYKINGHLNFKAYILIACLQSFLILYFLYREFKKLSMPLYLFVPIVFIWLQPQYHEISDWAITGLQHTFLVVFLFIALRSIKSTEQFKDIFLALVFASLATFTFGNGIFVFGAIGLYLLLIRQYKQITWVIITFVLNLLCYIKFYTPGGAASIPSNFTNFFISLSALMGGTNMEWFSKGFYISIGIGVVVLSILVYAIIKNIFYKMNPTTNPILLAIMGFIFMTLTLISFIRSGTGLALASRYEFYSALMLICIYLLFLPKMHTFRWVYFLGFLFYSIIFNAFSYYYYTHKIDVKKNMFIADCFNWNNTRTMFCVEPEFLRNTAPFMIPMAQKNILVVPKGPISQNEIEQLIPKAEALPTAEPKAEIINNIEHIQEKAGVRTRQSYIFEHKTYPSNRDFSHKYFLVLSDTAAHRSYLCGIESGINTRINFLKTRKYYLNGSKANIQSGQMLSGNYNFYYLYINKTEKRLFNTGKKLQLNNGNFINS